MNTALNKDTRKCLDTCNELKRVHLENDKEKGKGIPPDVFDELNFWYRMLLRVFCSEVEGISHLMKKIIGWAYVRGDITLSAAEATLINEHEYFFDVKSKKIAIKEGRFSRTLESVLLTLEIFPRVFQTKCRPNYGINGWEQFQRSIDLRNRITHPKTADDLLALTEIIAAVPAGSAWYYGCLSNIFKSIDPKIFEASRAQQQKSLDENSEISSSLINAKIESLKAEAERISKGNQEVIDTIQAQSGDGLHRKK